jgi:hypothetical protein
LTASKASHSLQHSLSGKIIDLKASQFQNHSYSQFLIFIVLLQPRTTPTTNNNKIMDKQEPPRTAVLNSDAIRLNTAAINALQAGDLLKGFHLLSRACSNLVRQKTHQVAGHPVSSSRRRKHEQGELQYSFEDCTWSLARYHVRSSSIEQSSSSTTSDTTEEPARAQGLLCLKFLRINTVIELSDETLNKRCSCGVGWVLEYK